MSCIHYKFRSSLEYDTITFDGLAISLGDLKKAIMAQKKIAKVTDFDLEVTNAQTKEEYKDESTQIPKNSSVVVRRIPTGTRSKAQLAADRPNTYASGLPKTKSDSQELHNAVTSKQKILDLVNSDASEEDKLKLMMSQAGEDWQPNQYVRGRGRGYNPSGPLPPNYVCYRCGKPGHFIRNCPTNGAKRTIGIPRKFGEETTTEPTDEKDIKKDSSDSNKKLVPVPVQEVKAKPDRTIPSELKCPMCQNLLSDAVLIPCCGTSYCDECIRTYLLENEQICLTCGAEDVSPDSLIINKQLRQAVNNFRNARPASPFVNSTSDKPSPASSTIDKTTPSTTVENQSQSSNTDKPTSSDVKPSPSNTASPEIRSPDTSEKEKSEENVTSTTSETIEKGDVSEVKKDEVIKKEGSPLAVLKGEGSSPRHDTSSDGEDHLHSGPRHYPRDLHRQVTRPGGHVAPMPGYGQHPMHRPRPSIVHPMVDPIIPRSVPPDGALLVTPIRTARPILTRMHAVPIIPRPGFMAATALGMHPTVVHPLPMEPNMVGAPLPFGVKPPGFHPFNERDGPPMSEEEFYRQQNKLKLRTKRKHKEREREKGAIIRETKSSNRNHPANFDDELSQYRALQRNRTNYRSRSRSRTPSRSLSLSRSKSLSRSFSKSPSQSSHSLSKSPTPEDWDRSRTPSPSTQAVSESKSAVQNDDKKLKRKKRKKHKHKHSKKRKTEHNAEDESTKEQTLGTEKMEKKKTKLKKKSKEKIVKVKSQKKKKVDNEKEDKIENDNLVETVEKKSTEVPQKVEKEKSTEKNHENIDDKENSETKTTEVNESKKSKNSEEVQDKSETSKRKSKEKSSDKKHKKKKHKHKHKKHKKEKDKIGSQNAEENNPSTEETQESEEENGK